jgi:hypothetical protein
MAIALARMCEAIIGLMKVESRKIARNKKEIGALFRTPLFFVCELPLQLLLGRYHIDHDQLITIRCID